MDPRSPTGGGAVLGDAAPRATAAPRRVRTRPEPRRRPQFEHLTLDGLRGLRKDLNAEEAQISYWRRIIQARLDLVRAGEVNTADGAKLRSLLTDARLTSSRSALLEIVPVAEIPPLPLLAELWDREVDPQDGPAMSALEADLDVAERQISAYRRALHERIDEATGELIARYRETPADCLAVLPLPPVRPNPLTARTQPWPRL